MVELDGTRAWATSVQANKEVGMYIGIGTVLVLLVLLVILL